MTLGDDEKVSPSLLSASAVMAAGTVLSRLTGFARASLLGAAIGIGMHADVFNVATTIPNSLYILVAGGVFNTVLVPQLIRAMRNDADHGEAYASRVMTLGALLLASVTVVLIAIAPLFLRLVASRYFTDPKLAAERDSLVMLTRLCLPMIFFYGMFVLVGQILNARRRFGPMMWAPIANNVVSVGVIVAFIVLYSDRPAGGGYTRNQELLLGVGSLAGIVVQTLILVPYLRATGFRIRPRFDFKGTGLGQTLRLSTWMVGLVVVNQLAFYVVTNRSTSGAGRATEAGGYTVYANAFLITQVPHAIVTVSLATVTMTAISAFAADHRFGDLRAEMVRTIRLVLAILIPVAFAIAVLGPSIATVLFSWGKATGDTRSLGLTLIAFAPGLLMFTIQYVALRGFYALEDTRTPFFLQLLIATINVVTAIALTRVVDPQFIAPALAVAYGLAFLCGAAASVLLLSRRLGGFGTPDLGGFLARTVVAAVLAATAALVTELLLRGVGFSGATKADALVLLVAGSVVGGLGYVGLARLLDISEIDRVVAMITGRGRTR